MVPIKLYNLNIAGGWAFIAVGNFKAHFIPLIKRFEITFFTLNL
jgi:hypothetical protein